MANVYAVIEDLENSKANARKKAVDALPTLLDEPAKRNQLSDASWVGLVKKSIESAKLDLLAAKKTRRAPRREVGDLVERITSWAADGPSGRRLAGCAEDLLNFSSAAYGEAGEVWCISYGRVLERLLGEPEAIEAAAVALAGRNLDGRQAARRICAPAARIARGRFPDPAPPPHERAGARKAAAAALRRLAERGADLADDRYAREALARACAGCLRNLYVEEKLDDEAPAVLTASLSVRVDGVDGVNVDDVERTTERSCASERHTETRHKKNTGRGLPGARRAPFASPGGRGAAFRKGPPRPRPRRRGLRRAPHGPEPRRGGHSFRAERRLRLRRGRRRARRPRAQEVAAAPRAPRREQRQSARGREPRRGAAD